MTEEARLENTSPEASQPDKKTEDQKSLTDKNSDLPTGTLKSQQTKEQKTMANSPQIPQTPKTLDDAKTEFVRIKTALIGPQPEWCLPQINKRAQASIPKIDDQFLNKTTCPPLETECTEVVK